MIECSASGIPATVIDSIVGLTDGPYEIILFSQDHGKFDILTTFSQVKPMQVRERRANTTASRLNGRTVMCVVALTLAGAEEFA